MTSCDCCGRPGAELLWFVALCARCAEYGAAAYERALGLNEDDE